VKLEFLTPSPDVSAASPIEPWLRAAGARFEAREGWRVAVSVGDPTSEQAACRSGVGIADRSALGKLELQGRPERLAALLESAQLEEALHWRSSPDRALAVCEPGAAPRLRALLGNACEQSGDCGLVDLTAAYAAFELRGPLTRSLLERLSAIDVRPDSLPPGGVRAGMVARVPATLVCLEWQAFLVLVGAPEAPDAWEIALDEGEPLGLRAVGEEARARA
jgi:glycine cleavage system aminomethyltransferase T